MPSVHKPIITALAVATVLGLSSCQHPAAEKTVLKDDKDKVSYSIGTNIGKKMRDGMKAEKVDINSDMLIAGIRDAFANKTVLTDAEMQSVMEKFQKDMMAKAEADNKALSDKNQKEGSDFLAANKAKDGVKTTNSGLQYKIVTQGKPGGQTPALTDSVTVNYRGTLINGTEFDSSAKNGKPVTFPINQVIPGWTEALQLMKEGDKMQIYVPSNLAYGERSPSPEIGPNSTLIFDIELLSVQKGAAQAPAAGATSAPDKGKKTTK